MKVKPVIDALDERGVDVVLVHTGQHYDDAMSEVFFRDLDLRQPDVHLGVGSGSHAVQTAAVMTAFEPVVQEIEPDVVVVVGDVNSTMACALVGAKLGTRVAHVEAGLRSRDWSMPEEINRVVTDRVSDYLFSPSADAVDNLLAEGRRAESIFLVGNVMIDTLLANLDAALARPTLADAGLEPGGYALATLHRPANVDDPEVLGSIVAAFDELSRRCPVVFPAHPRTTRMLTVSDATNVRFVEPFGYLDFIALEANARMVLTDSGGVQEETTALGVPCLTLRENTERPITVTEGTNQVVGVDPAAIVAAGHRVLERGVERRCPDLWDGKAGVRIRDILVDQPLPPDPA